MSTNLLDTFVESMIALNWEVETVYPDEESKPGTRVVSMLYKKETSYVWSMFDLIDGVDSFQCKFVSGVANDEYNDCVHEVAGPEYPCARAKEAHWSVFGVVGSGSFYPDLSKMINEWASSVDIALWLQHVSDYGSGMPHNQIYAAAWYGKTEFIKSIIAEAISANKDRHFGLSMDQLSRALKVARDRAGS